MNVDYMICKSFKKQNLEESLEKIITDIHQQISEKTDVTVEDTTYKMPPHRHKDETNSAGEVLVKIMKKIRQEAKPSAKKLQMRFKKCARSKAEKRGKVSKTVQVL